MSELNIELFKKVRERIATVPESYNQRVFVEDSRIAPCGTVCCIAGETVICAASTVSEGVTNLKLMDDLTAPDGSQWVSLIPHTAQQLLRLSDKEAKALFEFAENGWPEPFRGRYMDTSDDTDRANVAVLLLDHIIATGKVLE